MEKDKIFENIQENIAIENFRTIHKKHERTKRILQSTLTVMICCLSITGIVFAKDISTKLYDNFFMTGKGMETAMNEGYIEDTNMDYENANATVENTETGEIIEDVETKVKVSEFVMDDFNLSITFDVELSEKAKELVTADEIWKFNFPDLVISDEKNIVLYCQSGVRYEEFSKEKNLGLDYNEAMEQKMYIGSGVNIIPVQREGNHVKVIYNIYTGGDSHYPKSKTLTIDMTKINISQNEQASMGEEEITLTGDWHFDVAVPEKMYNRQSVVYTQTDTTNEDYQVESATLYDTGMEITAKVQTEALPQHPEFLEFDFYDSLPEDDPLRNKDILSYISWKERQTDEYKEYHKKINELTDITVYLTNENGEKFTLIQGPNENGSVGVNEEGILTFEGMFDLTKYNQAETVIVHFEYNNQIEEVVLKKGDE